MTSDDERGFAQTETPGGEQLRDALRAALDRFIDPDDDTMPYVNLVDGGYTWTPVEPVVDALVAILDRAIDKRGQLRELVGQGPPYDSNDVEWDCGWNTAMDEVQKILDGKEQP